MSFTDMAFHNRVEAKHETRRASFPRDRTTSALNSFLPFQQHEYPDYPPMMSETDNPKLIREFFNRQSCSFHSADELESTTAPFRRFSECTAKPEQIRRFLASHSCQPSLRRTTNVCLTSSRMGQEPFGESASRNDNSSNSTLTLEGATIENSTCDVFANSVKEKQHSSNSKSELSEDNSGATENDEKIIYSPSFMSSKTTGNFSISSETESKELDGKKPPVSVTFSKPLAFTKSEERPNSGSNSTISETQEKSAPRETLAEPAVSPKVKLELPSRSMGPYQVTVNAKIRRASTDRYNSIHEISFFCFKFFRTFTFVGHSSKKKRFKNFQFFSNLDFCRKRKKLRVLSCFTVTFKTFFN